MLARHPRKYLTPAQKAAVIRRQNGICGCGCGEPLGDPRDIDFDHVHELWNGGANDLGNFAAVIRRHHLVKTRTEAKARAKVKRLEANGGRRKMTAGERELARLMERAR